MFSCCFLYFLDKVGVGPLETGAEGKIEGVGVPALLCYIKPDLCEIGNSVTKWEARFYYKRVPWPILIILKSKSGTIHLGF